MFHKGLLKFRYFYLKLELGIDNFDLFEIVGLRYNILHHIADFDTRYFTVYQMVLRERFLRKRLFRLKNRSESAQKLYFFNFGSNCKFLFFSWNQNYKNNICPHSNISSSRNQGIIIATVYKDNFLRR